MTHQQLHQEKLQLQWLTVVRQPYGPLAPTTLQQYHVIPQVP